MQVNVFKIHIRRHLSRRGKGEFNNKQQFYFIYLFKCPSKAQKNKNDMNTKTIIKLN